MVEAMKEVTPAAAWDLGYQTALDKVETELLRAAANGGNVNVKLVVPATNPYKEE